MDCILMKKLIQILRLNLMMTGINITRVATMTIKDVDKVVPRNKKEMINAATANATPTA